MISHNRHQLLSLTYIRMLVLLVLSASLLVGIEVFDVVLHVRGLILALVVLLAVTVLTYARQWLTIPVTSPEWFIQLSVDALLYAALLFQAGGASNPLAFLLLIPLLVTATTLPWRYTALMALLVTALYSGLLFFHVPLLQLASAHRHSLLNYLDLQATGLWLNFVVTVVIVALFVARMRLDLHLRERQLHAAHEKQIRDQQLLSLATLAAGTAHELGTPLSTVQVVLGDLLADPHPERDPSVLRDDLTLMYQQVNLCAERLRSLRTRAQPSDPSVEPIDQVLRTVLADWQLMRPGVTFAWQPPVSPAPLVLAGPILQQALLNLLNNAADANPVDVQITLTWHADTVLLTIADHGPGIPPALLDELGETFVTTKGGLGIGLYLSNATLAAQQGQIRLFNRPEGGTRADVSLPIVENGP